MVTRVALPDHYQKDGGVLMHDVVNVSSIGSVIAGAKQDNTDSAFVRSGTAKPTSTNVLVTSNAGATLEVDITVDTAAANGKRLFGMWVYVPDYTRITQLVLFITPDNFATFLKQNKAINRDGWWFMGGTPDTSANDWTSETGPTSPTASFNKVRFRIESKAGQQGQAYLDSVWSRPLARPQCMIMADDSEGTLYTNGKAGLDNNGILIGLGLIPSRHGNSGLLTAAQAKELYDDGHDAHVHGATAWTGLSDSAIEDDIHSELGLLVAAGMTRGNGLYVYPNGVFERSAGDPTYSRLLPKIGFTHARLASSRYEWLAHGLPSDLHINAVNVGVGTNTLQQLKDKLDDTIIRGSLICYMAHQIPTSGATGLGINKADWESLLAHVAQRRDQGLVDVMRPSDFIKGLAGARAA